MAWWEQKPLRLIQTNLREIDARLDIDEYIASLEEFSANVLLFNVGGIVANYPSALEFHYVNPNLKGDFVGQVIERVHERGMKFIARFDFSRLNEQCALPNPDWLYRSIEGKIVNYNGQVHTCINGFYQQEYSLDILREVAERYPIDGIFFNMHGYVTHDYSYNYYGICQCGSCRKRFLEYTGHERLPLQEDPNDPVFRDYEKFRTETVRELFLRRVEVVKSINPHIAICNYTHSGTDIFRKESNTGMNRPLPEWNYSATENVRTVRGTWDGMAVSNSAVHFVDYAMRHTAVSPHLTGLRLVQNLVNGGGLDYYVIGTLINQDDRLCFDLVKDIYRFHQKHEDYYSNLTSLAEICLVVPESSSMYGSKNELKGIMRIFAENHVQYDLLHDSMLQSPQIDEKLRRYKLLILADQRSMSDEAVQAVDRFVEGGGKLLATGFTSTCDLKGHPMGRIRLQSIGAREFVLKPQTQGAYFRIRETDKTILKHFEQIDLVYLYGEALECKLGEGAAGFLGLIPSCMFGPPEKCYITEETDTAGLIHNRYGKGESAYIPWGIGAHYEKLSNHGHARLLMAAIRDVLSHRESLQVTASPLVEICLYQGPSRRLVSAVNGSGQLGTAFHAPIPIRDIRFTLRADSEPSRVYRLRRSGDIPFVYSNGQLSFHLDELDLFETVVVED
ncbi:family 10 glycosylhydrolase [Paenibacillus sp. GD4]|uniref:alpha-amylase family protein n=1 Tax=Paenibacillus sp. GD4 TaxID=3068890 RepID=UPI0027963E7C|nr:alpha-amylase family protein [Paenibacillus sp. GD4]MDQ1914514.1 family 10 glycosylhydrolase [Paenibacillus sp. GD4]